MLEFSWFICCIAYFMVYDYVFYTFARCNENRLKYKSLIFAVINGFLFIMINKLDLLYFRPYIMQLYFLVIFKFLYKQKFIKTIICILAIFGISCVSEIIYDLMILLIFKIDIRMFVTIWYGYLTSNIAILLITFWILRFKMVNNLFNSIINWYNNNEFKSFMLVVSFFMIIFTFLTYNNFMKYLPNSFMMLVNIFAIAIIFFVINYFKEKANNNRIIDEYDQLLGYVQRYEKVVEDKSKNQHEYKNQLVMLKGMISKSNKKAINYLDSLYKDTGDNEDIELLKKLKYLPSGGLKGLIYYKIEEMIDKDITVFVDISSEIKNIKIDKEIDKNLKDISKIIGVYLDNAIEACINSKEKYIVLEVYLENNEWVFSLSNTYSNNIDFSLVDKEGYTTKGDGKGYGLSLAKDILSHHKELREERELNGIYYTQRLYLDIKK